MQDKQLVSLIVSVKEGSDDAYAEVARQFDPLVRAVCHKFKASFEKLGSFSETDLKQELSLALYRACMGYDTRQDKVTFGKFAKRCLENCAVSVLRKAESRHKREGKAVEQLRREHSLESFFSQSGAEEKSEMLRSLSDALSSYEYAVFTRYLDGFSASEIAQELNKEEKSVNNAVFRSKVKIKTVYKNKNQT